MAHLKKAATTGHLLKSNGHLAKCPEGPLPCPFTGKIRIQIANATPTPASCVTKWGNANETAALSFHEIQTSGTWDGVFDIPYHSAGGILPRCTFIRNSASDNVIRYRTISRRNEDHAEGKPWDGVPIFPGIGCNPRSESAYADRPIEGIATNSDFHYFYDDHGFTDVWREFSGYEFFTSWNTATGIGGITVRMANANTLGPNELFLKSDLHFPGDFGKTFTNDPATNGGFAPDFTAGGVIHPYLTSGDQNFGWSPNFQLTLIGWVP